MSVIEYLYRGYGATGESAKVIRMTRSSSVIIMMMTWGRGFVNINPPTCNHTATPNIFSSTLEIFSCFVFLTKTMKNIIKCMLKYFLQK